TDLMRASGAENARRAEALFREVIALDPEYMPAQRGLLAALIFIVNFYPERAEASFDDMDALLTGAIERAPSANIAHQLRAFQKLRVHNDRLGARQELDAGLRIAPQERRAQLEELLAIIHAQTGWLSATVGLARTRARAEPLSLETSRRLQGA